ncbi:MAG: YqiA/YcfP family alpha/beta fold hydrolase [Bacteroidota bacterium]
MKRFANPKNLDTDALYKMPKIRAVYIHGLDSEPLPGKMEIMKQAGFDVSAIHINYRENKDAYAELKKLIVEKKTEFIIGSSFGGMLGYWLSEELGISALLFNPAMVYQSVQVDLPKIENLKCPMRIVVLGEQDDVVDPVKNKQFFGSKQRDGLIQKVLSCSWLGHSIDFQTFEEMTFFAVRNYSIWKLMNINKH